VEKLNDDCRRIHLQRSNKWDAPKDVLSCWSKKDWKILPVMKGAQDLPKSIPNNTGKHVHIIENRAKRIRVCQQSAPAVLDTVNVDKLKK
jgi:hypothetical protein